MILFSCEEALDCTHAIYEVSPTAAKIFTRLLTFTSRVKQNVFIDLVLTLIVEEHVVRDLEHIFYPRLVGRMTENEILSIASEPEGLKRERLHYQDDLSRLQDRHRLLRSVIGNRGGMEEAGITKNV